MSAIDDARKLVQDIVAPDLKAITARLEALKRAVKQGFEGSEKLSEVRHEMTLLRVQTGFASIDAKFTAADARFDSILKAMNIDRRLELLEAAKSSQPQLESSERHA